ncbi:MAG TPA: hypothetical protein DIV86_03835 [Alphaproteobacteria bacterium]|nr:hypothetical protein [Alphaproteobacteria bacterium]
MQITTSKNLILNPVINNLPGPLKAVVVSLHTITQAPLDMCLSSALTVLGIAVQGNNKIQTIMGEKILSLFFMTMADSGERKSAVDTLAMKGVLKYELELRNLYEKEFEIYKISKEQWSERRKILAKTKGISTEQIIEEIGPEPKPPVIPSIIHSDFTTDGLYSSFDSGCTSCGLVCDETAMIFGSGSMSASNRSRTTAFLCKVWDGKTLTKTRHEKFRSISDVKLSIHFMMQPAIAEKYLSDNLLKKQGFMSRYLITYPESNIGNRLIEFSDERKAELEKSHHIIEEFSNKIYNLLKNSSKSEVQIIIPSDQFNVLAAKFSNKNELEMKEGGKLSQIKEFTSKSYEHLYRLYGVLKASFSDANVSEDELITSSLSLIMFYTQNMFEFEVRNNVITLENKALKLLNYMEINGIEMIYPSKISQNIRGIENVAEAKRIGNYLVECGKFEFYNETDNKNKKVIGYRLVPNGDLTIKSA